MTLSPPAVLLGDQRPRVSSVPPAVSSTGAEAIELAESAGVHLYPWQQFALDAMLGERADGNWSSYEVGFMVARQNGKGEVLLARELAGLFLLEERFLLHSAHLFPTSKEAFLRIKAVIEGAPHLASRVQQFYQSNAETAVVLKNGARLRFMARTNQSGRGFSAQTLLMDEAQEMSEQARAALMFTTSAQPNPQLIYTGTVPTSETANSEVWTSLRDRGRAGNDPQLAWLEWSAGEDDVDPDDRTGWCMGNPSLGYRITMEQIARERLSTPAQTFLEERLSYWPASDASKLAWKVVPQDTYRACSSEQRGGWLVGPVSLAVEMADDRSMVTIVAAGATEDGRTGVQIVARDANGPWVAPLLADRWANKGRPVSAVVVDPRSQAGSLVPALTDAGVPVVECSTADLVKATGTLLDAIHEGTVAFRTAEAMTNAVGGARLRKYGEAHLIDRWSAGDPTPFIGAVLARWGMSKPAGDVGQAVW